MAIISTKWNYLYQLPPGAASTTVSEYLISNCEGVWIPQDDVFDDKGHFLVQQKHSTINELLEHSIITKESLDSLVKFTTMRNPFDLIFTEWKRSRVRWLKEMKDTNSWIYKSPGRVAQIIEAVELEFSDWVELKLAEDYEKGSKRHFLNKYIAGVDYVIKIEELDAELKSLLSKIGIEVNVEITPKNVTPTKMAPYWQHYNQRAREIVSSIYEPDLKKFNYSF